jgi:hypothetical protein
MTPAYNDNYSLLNLLDFLTLFICEGGVYEIFIPEPEIKCTIA